jgi:hypothetical protein
MSYGQGLGVRVRIRGGREVGRLGAAELGTLFKTKIDSNF